jgi:tetraprenyl-beta-curcumene synthase
MEYGRIRRWIDRQGEGLADAGALLVVSVVYWLQIQPQARRELLAWEHRARCIRDGVLRECALRKLTSERLNPEAAALFAVLAPRARRREIVSLLVAYQVLYDYLDALNERPDGAELEKGLQLHRALTEALLPTQPVSDYYRHYAPREKGAYMRPLAEACRRAARTLPSIDDFGPTLALATRRCGEAQAYNHAVLMAGEADLRRWSMKHARREDGYLWWELAAAGISNLAIHSLLACAANPKSTAEDAANIDRAYFPSVCAISALLDSLADYHGDSVTANHSFVAHYCDKEQVAERLSAITAEAHERIASLPGPRRHAIILAAVCAYYLSSRAVRQGFPALAAAQLIDGAGPAGTLLRAMVRARRLLLQGQSRWRARSGNPREQKHEQRGARDDANRPERLRDGEREGRRKARDITEVAVDQPVSVEAGAGAGQRAREQHQS